VYCVGKELTDTVGGSWTAGVTPVPKETVKDALLSVHNLNATLFVKGLTNHHVLSVDMFTKEQANTSIFHVISNICILN